jgi:plastocyanin
VRQFRLIGVLLPALVVAACSSASVAWTYAPAPPATPRPSVSASPSAAPSASASTQPSASGGQGSPAASPGNVVTVVATSAAKFDTPELTMQANTPFTLVFDNQDATAPHNVILQNPDGSNVQMGGDTNFFTGPAKRQYQIGPLTAGKYPFHCQVHPNMTGTLTVQ